MDIKMIKIKHFHTGAVLFAAEAVDIKTCLEAAVENGVNLTGAGLTGASLTGASLTGADLTYADLTGANLADADLTDANLADADLTGAGLTGAGLIDADLTGAGLTGANLADANLADADLTDADLAGANLTGANLAGADLAGADLAGADLTDADLTRANLSIAKKDTIAVLKLVNTAEIRYLLDALKGGRINGATYAGDCCCLIGTLEKARAGSPHLRRRQTRPAERFFTGIKPGDTPDNNPVSRIIVNWINEYLESLK